MDLVLRKKITHAMHFHVLFIALFNLGQFSVGGGGGGGGGGG